MPAPPKYPLEPLLAHRRRQVDDATAELGAAMRSREDAEASKARASRDEQDADARARAVRGRERDLLARGELRVADLARAEAWEIAAEVERAAHAQAVAVAADHLRASTAEERSARDALAARKAGQDVIEKDRARFVEARAERQLAAEEEAAEEAHRAGRGGRG